MKESNLDLAVEECLCKKQDKELVLMQETGHSLVYKARKLNKICSVKLYSFSQELFMEQIPASSINTLIQHMR